MHQSISIKWGEAALEDQGERATATRRDCLIGSAALILSAGADAPAAMAAPAPIQTPAPLAPEAAGGCTPFRRVYLQK